MNKIKFIISMLVLALVAMVAVLPLMAEDVKVTWPAAPASEMVTSYEVWIGTNGNSPTLAGPAATVTTNEAIFPDMASGVYTFAVRSKNLAGYSIYSDASAGPSLPSKPGTPTVEVTP